MNNLRFTNGKRKNVLSKFLQNTSTGQSNVTVADITGSSSANFRITKIEFQLNNTPAAGDKGADVLVYPAAVTVLGRSAELIAYNSTGPDGFYKIPEEHILRKWFNGADQSMSSYVLVEWDTVDDNVEVGLTVTIYYETVA